MSQPRPYGSPPAGELELHLTPPVGLLPGITPSCRIDGAAVGVGWGLNLLPVVPGRHQVRVELGTLGQGRAQHGIVVRPGERVQLHYAAPGNGKFRGALGPTPQGGRGRAALIITLAAGGAVLLIGLILLLVLVLVG